MYSVSLKSGVTMPSIAFGTDFQGKPSVAAIKGALDAGVTLIDTATGYGSHPDVAAAIEGRDRSGIFICTKFHNGNMAGLGSVDAVLDSILAELRTDYIDLLLIHNPGVEGFGEVFKRMIALKEAGKVRSIGVSNFTIDLLRRLGGDIAHVDVNQVEFHPYLFQRELADFCRDHEIKIMAYRPFCEGRVLLDPAIGEIAAAHAKTPAQVVLRWLQELDMVPVFRTANPQHLAENILGLDFTLDGPEKARIASLHRSLRSCTGPWAQFNDSPPRVGNASAMELWCRPAAGEGILAEKGIDT